MARVPIAPRPQLLTYPDSLGGGLAALGSLLDGPLDGLFHGVHVLPPFPSSGDRGFAPLTYREIDPRFGSWGDIRRLAARHDVELDLTANHASRKPARFTDFPRPRRPPRCHGAGRVEQFPRAAPADLLPPTCSSPSTRCGPTAGRRSPTSPGSS